MDEGAWNRPNGRSSPSGDKVFAITLPTVLREIDDNDSETGKWLQCARRRFTEQLISGEQAVKTPSSGRCDQITVRKRLPPPILGRVTADAQFSQNGHKMDVHVGVKRPHGTNR
jgi:hypothetical protein